MQYLCVCVSDSFIHPTISSEDASHLPIGKGAEGAAAAAATTTSAAPVPDHSDNIPEVGVTVTVKLLPRSADVLVVRLECLDSIHVKFVCLK